jgi:CheY-like chemotaxis protein
MTANEAVLREIQALRLAQEETSRTLREVLNLLRAPPLEPRRPAAIPALFPPVSTPKMEVRVRHRSVVLIDDDSERRHCVEAAFAVAHMPVRAFADGHAALAAIAAQKPDVIVVEPDLSGAMTGKDVINMIRSTMEWVNIPIVLHSGRPMSREDARTLHGGDDVVSKDAGEQTLVERVLKLFQDA